MLDVIESEFERLNQMHKLLCKRNAPSKEYREVAERMMLLVMNLAHETLGRDLTPKEMEIIIRIRNKNKEVMELIEKKNERKNNQTKDGN